METVAQSMYPTDFQPLKVETEIKSFVPVRRKPRERSQYRPMQMDLEILQPFKPEVDVPFSLLQPKKPILHTNPHDPIPELILEDKFLEQKIQARQRRSAVYMVPQIDMEKIPDDVKYGENGDGNGLISSIYSSDWKKAVDVAVQNSPFNLRDDPLKRKFTKNDIVHQSFDKTRYKAKSKIPPMEIGLENHLSAWKKQNPIEFVDTTKLFWEKRKETGSCSSCECKDTVKGLSNEESTELNDCLKEDALRTPFTLHPPGYTGYVPRLAAGIQFRRKKFTKYDPFVTTLNTFQGVCDTDSF